MNPTNLVPRIGLTAFVTCFIAVSVAHAQDPLSTWGPRTVPGPSTNLYSVAFGNGVFVAVGDNSFVARSADGANWTTSTAGAFGNLARVRFLNGQFVAVGSSDRILFSANGAAWTSSTLPTSGFWDVAQGNGVYVVAGSTAWMSGDGANWTEIHPIPDLIVHKALDSIVFRNGGFLGLPYRSQMGPGPDKSVYSTNGVDWMEGGQAPATLGGGVSELLFNDGLWLATADWDLSPLYGVWASTNNGASWDASYVPPLRKAGGALAFGQGTYVYVQNGPINVLTSTDTHFWAFRYSGSAGVIKAAAFGNGTFVLVGGYSGASYILQSGNLSGTPIIVKQPQDRGAVAMNPASFSVEVVGALPLTYQWYKNGSTIANATNATFTVASVETGDIGGYQAVIANSFGSVTSRVAQLTVAFLDIHCYAGISVLGVPGRTYRIEASPAQGAPNWQTVTNLVLPQSPYIWIDYESPSLPSRIYRASELP